MSYASSSDTRALAALRQAPHGSSPFSSPFKRWDKPITIRLPAAEHEAIARLVENSADGVKALLPHTYRRADKTMVLRAGLALLRTQLGDKGAAAPAPKDDRQLEAFNELNDLPSDFEAVPPAKRKTKKKQLQRRKTTNLVGRKTKPAGKRLEARKTPAAAAVRRAAGKKKKTKGGRS